MPVCTIEESRKETMMENQKEKAVTNEGKVSEKQEEGENLQLTVFSRAILDAVADIERQALLKRRLHARKTHQ